LGIQLQPTEQNRTEQNSREEVLRLAAVPEKTKKRLDGTYTTHTSKIYNTKLNTGEGEGSVYPRSVTARQDGRT
jgi:hypothetical protein